MIISDVSIIIVTACNMYNMILNLRVIYLTFQNCHPFPYSCRVQTILYFFIIDHISALIKYIFIIIKRCVVCQNLIYIYITVFGKLLIKFYSVLYLVYLY